MSDAQVLTEEQRQVIADFDKPIAAAAEVVPEPQQAKSRGRKSQKRPDADPDDVTLEPEAKRARDDNEPEPEPVVPANIPPPRKTAAPQYRYYDVKTFSFKKNTKISDVRTMNNAYSTRYHDIKPDNGARRTILRFRSARIDYKYGVENGQYGARMHVSITDPEEQEALRRIQQEQIDLVTERGFLKDEDGQPTKPDKNNFVPFTSRTPKNRVTARSEAAKKGKPLFKGDDKDGYYDDSLSLGLSKPGATEDTYKLMDRSRTPLNVPGADSENYFGINGCRADVLDVALPFSYYDKDDKLATKLMLVLGVVDTDSASVPTDAETAEAAVESVGEIFY